MTAPIPAEHFAAARQAKAVTAHRNWSDFQQSGIDCLTGHVGATPATVQIMLLPALILLWSITLSLFAVGVR